MEWSHNVVACIRAPNALNAEAGLARTIFVPVLALFLVAACGSSSSGDDGVACIETSGPQTICLTWSNTTRSQVDGFCQNWFDSGAEEFTLVSSCPTDNVLGTCTIKQSSSTMTQVLYDYPGATCSDGSEWCAGSSNAGFMAPNEQDPWNFQCNGD
jgi:hypothetical protein